MALLVGYSRRHVLHLIISSIAGSTFCQYQRSLLAHRLRHTTLTKIGYSKIDHSVKATKKQIFWGILSTIWSNKICFAKQTFTNCTRQRTIDLLIYVISVFMATRSYDSKDCVKHNLARTHFNSISNTPSRKTENKAIALSNIFWSALFLTLAIYINTHLKVILNWSPNSIFPNIFIQMSSNNIWR